MADYDPQRSARRRNTRPANVDAVETLLGADPSAIDDPQPRDLEPRASRSGCLGGLFRLRRR